jgi:DNA-binding MarR family transcriptional regulator
MKKDRELFGKLPLGRYLSVATKLYFGALTKRLEKLEVERHYSVLVFINSNKKKFTQQYIADYLKIDKASMVRIVDYLAKKKYLRRIENPKDRREYLLELTSKAKETMPVIHKAIIRLNQVATKGLSKKKTEEFYETICHVCDNLSKEPFAKVIINYKRAKEVRK